MYLSTSSSDRDSSAAAHGERRPPRAGLRVPPSGDQPNGVFVVVEMVVLVIVAALAMASIIVSSGSTDDDVHTAGATGQSRLQTVREAGDRLFAAPTGQAGRPDAPVPAR